MPDMHSWPAFGIAVAIALVAAYAVGALSSLPFKVLMRHRGWSREPGLRARRPFRVLAFVLLLWLAAQLTFPWRGWLEGIGQVFLIVAIGCGAWLVSAIVSIAFGQTLARYPIDVADNRAARRVHTQLALLRRLSIAVITVVAAGAILLTFDGVRAVGASLLASAGLVSVVAGLAAQSTLSNVFAGLQLAFSDAIRVDDVVIAEEQWGRIEEITLTYVVLRIWDERRLVLPSTYFTSTPFENWTRRDSELLGTVELDLDWRVDLDGLRRRLDEVLAGTELWDGRSKVIQITEATGGMVQVRVLVTAENSGTLWDLRCLVREELVSWVQRHNPEALPLTRVQLEHEKQAGRPGTRPAAPAGAGDSLAPAALAPSPERSDQDQREGLFSGSEEAERRAERFTSGGDGET